MQPFRAFLPPLPRWRASAEALGGEDARCANRGRGGASGDPERDQARVREARGWTSRRAGAWSGCWLRGRARGHRERCVTGSWTSPARRLASKTGLLRRHAGQTFVLLLAARARWRGWAPKGMPEPQHRVCVSPWAAAAASSVGVGLYGLPASSTRLGRGRRPAAALLALAHAREHACARTHLGGAPRQQEQCTELCSCVADAVR